MAYRTGIRVMSEGLTEVGCQEGFSPKSLERDEYASTPALCLCSETIW
jgi:hypothetical protein